MKYTLSILIVACFSLFLLGCPYSSSVPITAATDKPDKKFAGRWMGDDNKVYDVTAAGAEYEVMVEEQGGQHGPAIYRGYFSQVKGTTFLNLYAVGKADKMYDIYELEFPDKNTLVVREMSENIREKFSSSEAFKVWIEKHMYDSDFHKPGDGPLTLIRL